MIMDPNLYYPTREKGRSALLNIFGGKAFNVQELIKRIFPIFKG